MKQDIKCIFFDVGGVLNKSDFSVVGRSLSQHSPLSTEHIYKNLFDIAKYYEKSKITSEQFYQEILEKFKIKELTFDEFKQIWQEVVLIFNEDIKNILEKINPDIKKAILSNTNEIHWEYIAQVQLVKKYFSNESQNILSFQAGSK